MLNQVTLIGRVVEVPTIRKYEPDYVTTTVVLAVARPFKNVEGNYETDFFRISLWNGVAQNACEYLQKGDIIGIKARLAMKDSEVCFSKEDGTLKKKISVVDIIGERVCFIHSNRRKIDEQEDENI